MHSAVNLYIQSDADAGGRNEKFSQNRKYKKRAIERKLKIASSSQGFISNKRIGLKSHHIIGGYQSCDTLRMPSIRLKGH